MTLTRDKAVVYNIHMIRDSDNKISVAVVMPDGVIESLAFTDTELMICDMIIAGAKHEAIKQATKKDVWQVENIVNSESFSKLLISRKHFAGRAAALTADFIKARLFDWVDKKTVPEKGELEVMKMAMQAAGLTGSVKQVSNRQVNNFSVSPRLAASEPQKVIDLEVKSIDGMPTEEARTILQAVISEPKDV